MEQINVLLVDDEDEFVQSLAERMKIRDLESGVALNGDQALKIVEEEIPDVMVLDLKMPGIDGLEVLRRVKTIYPQVQVIMLTGHGSAKDEQEALRLGAFEYFEKPTEMDKLVETIKKAYKHKKKIESAAETGTSA